MAIFKDFDLFISRLFFENGHFVWENNSFTNLMDKGAPEFLVFIAMLIFGIWLLGKISCKVLWGIDNKVVLLTTGTMFLGTGLVVNGIFKSFWGRARPEDIIEFGGDKIFSAPFVIADQCKWDCSFVSGHTAVAFWTLSLALLAPKKYRNMAICGALVFGTLMGIIRIGQGAHFFSDVLVSAVINVMIITWMYKKLYVKKKFS